MYLVDRKQTPRGVAETCLPFDGYKGGNEASSYKDNNITGSQEFPNTQAVARLG
jgi:hypothetical protein